MFNRTSLSKNRITAIINKGIPTGTINLVESGADGKSLRHLKEALQVHGPTVFSTLEMYGNNIGDEGLMELKDVIDAFPSICNIKLEFNDITSAGAQMLAQWLQTNNNVKRLNLYENRKIGDEGALAFAGLIKQGTSLKSLNLFGCGITDVGARAIAKAIMETKSSLVVDLNGNNVDESIIQAFTNYMTNKSNTDLPEIVEETEERQKQGLVSTQPPPRISSQAHTQAYNALEWEAQRVYFIKTLERLTQERRNNLILLYKDANYDPANNVVVPRFNVEPVSPIEEKAEPITLPLKKQQLEQVPTEEEIVIVEV